MVIATKLRLITAFLGDMPPDNRGMRRIRMENGRVKFTDTQWRERLETAARHLCMDVNIDSVLPPPGFVPATIHFHERRYNREKVERFEAFQAGTILTMNFVVDEVEKKAPTLDQFRMLMTFIGERLHMTQWGAGKFGYGAFKVEAAYIVDQTNFEPLYA